MIDFKKAYPHLIAIVIFYVLTFAYFSPLFSGKALKQSDVSQYKGMSKEIVDFREKYDSEPLWTNSMFSGMPAYQISVIYPGNLMPHIDKFYKGFFLPQPAIYFFSCMLGFYLLMLVLEMDVMLAVVGAIVFALSTYFLIIIEAGHNSKAGAISYMPAVLAGIIMTYRGRLILGAAVTALFLSLQLVQNHFQITYYLAITAMIYVAFVFVNSIKEKSLPIFLKSSAVLLIAAAIAVGPNITNILLTNEYSKATTRGTSELTNDAENKTSGLDKDYATQWSFDKAEVMTLLVPNYFGGATGVIGNDKAAMAKVDNDLKQYVGSINQYWGNQPFTSGPTYAGAIVMFLFVLALLIVDGPLKWGFLVATILSIMLSWGRNFMGFTEFFLDHFPGYNKFRTVTMILVIAELTIPVLALVALKKVLDTPNILKEKQKQFFIAFGLTGGLSFLMFLLPDMFNTPWADGEQNELMGQLKQAGWPAAQMDNFLSNVEAARTQLFTSDAMRSFMFILVSAAALYLYSIQKIFTSANKWMLIGAIGLLSLLDLWSVNRRYLNKENFIAKSSAEVPFTKTVADEQILVDKSLDYRVFNLAVNPFNDASTSYFHKSIGGYHGAKLKRYQELIENHISKNNMNVINMLNTKYFIVNNKQTNQPEVSQNPGALGNSWFVNEVKIVANADSEIKALTNFNPAMTAVVDKRFEQEVQGYKSKDSTAKITLTDYKTNYLTYESNSTSNNVAVFSEIYYQPGWNAYVDGQLKPHFRVNYVLRGMQLPAGKHKVEFKFEPTTYYNGQKIAYASSFLIILLVIGALFMEFKKKNLS